MSEYLMLGCGYTASRVARMLVDAGDRVVCTNRIEAKIFGAHNIALDSDDAASLHALRQHLSARMIVLNSISSTSGTRALLETLKPFEPQRMVYISTTGVYGAAAFVDELTIPCPDTDRDRARRATEDLITAGAWSSLILRPAAIYGPGRGVHTSVHAGVFRPPPGGDRMISRIHVDDLATHVYAAIKADVSGAFPVADEEPCPSSTVAAFAFNLLGLQFETGEREETTRDRKSGRRVDGSAYRRAMGLQLIYPTYREGVAACLKAEGPCPR